MSEFEDRINEWAKNRREVNSDDGLGFTAEVMRRVHGTSNPGSQRIGGKRILPEPLFASFCLVAGFGKLALVLHLAF